MVRLAPLFTISLIVAVAGAAQSVFPWPDSPVAMHIRTFAPAALWLILLVAAIVVHGRRGLWLFVGAPFALLIPIVWTGVYFVCECSIFQEG